MRDKAATIPMPPTARLSVMRRILLAMLALSWAAGCAAPQESGEADTCPSPNGSSAYDEAGSNDACPAEDTNASSARETAEDARPAPTG